MTKVKGDPKKAEGCISRNIVRVAVKMKTIVRIFSDDNYIELHLRNLDKLRINLENPEYLVKNIGIG